MLTLIFSREGHAPFRLIIDCTGGVKDPETHKFLMQVSREALWKNFKAFNYYRFDGRVPVTKRYFIRPQDNQETWHVLMSITHLQQQPLAFPLTSDLLKEVAVLASSLEYRGTTMREVGWVATNLKDCLPGDNAQLPIRFPGTPDPAVARTWEILCIAYVFDLQDVFARASRQLIWMAHPEELLAGLQSDLAHVLESRDESHFGREFEKVSRQLRHPLMEKLPEVFFPLPHGENGYCQECHSVDHTRRWYSELMSSCTLWESELTDSGAIFSLHFCFSHILSEIERGPKYSEHEGMVCGRYEVLKPTESKEELLARVYTNIGGLCLACFKHGGYDFQLHCITHDVDCG